MFTLSLSLSQPTSTSSDSPPPASQTKYRTHLARKFMKLMHEAQERQRALARTATVLQRAFRGMKGRQWAEIARNVVGVQSIRGPIQEAIASLTQEEAELRKRYTVLEGRIKLQEVGEACTLTCTRYSHSHW